LAARCAGRANGATSSTELDQAAVPIHAGTLDDDTMPPKALGEFHDTPTTPPALPKAARNAKRNRVSDG
jgi:hypothetical protein